MWSYPLPKNETSGFSPASVFCSKGAWHWLVLAASCPMQGSNPRIARETSVRQQMAAVSSGQDMSTWEHPHGGTWAPCWFGATPGDAAEPCLNDGSIVKAHWRQVGVAAEAPRCCPKRFFTRSQSVNANFWQGSFSTLFLLRWSILWYIVQTRVNQA